MSMAARKTPPAPQDGAEDELVPFNMRMSKRVLRALDLWLDDLNRDRRLGKVNRSDLIRMLLERGAAQRPNLDRAADTDHPVVVVHGFDGSEVMVLPAEEPLRLEHGFANRGSQCRAKLLEAHYQMLMPDGTIPKL